MSQIDTILDIVNESFMDSEYEGEVCYELTAAQETASFIDWVTHEFTATEAAEILSHGEELAIYGLVDDAQACYDAMESLIGEYSGDPLTAVTEARKVVVVDDWKKTNFSRQQYRNAMMLALNDKNPHAIKAQKYKKMFIAERNQVYKTYLTKAAKYTKDQMRNRKNKAANMKSAAGHQITDKIDKTLKQVDSKGRNKKAIKK